MRIEWNDRSPSQRPGRHLHRPRVETRRRQMRGGRFNPSGRRPSPDQGGSGYPIPEISAAKTPVSTKGVGKTVVVTAQRSIMQANSQDGSSGQSSSQQGIAAMAISFVSAEADCDVAETSTVTVRNKARKRRRTDCIVVLCWIYTLRSSRIAVSATAVALTEINRAISSKKMRWPAGSIWRRQIPECEDDRGSKASGRPALR